MQDSIKDFGEVLFEFPVLYAGWEMDDKGYVVQANDGTVMLVMSSHGRLAVADAADIEEKITEYQTAIDASRKALSLLGSAQNEKEWWRDKTTEICIFQVPLRDGSHVLTLNGRQVEGKWEYAILQWWHKSPTLWLLWKGSEMLKAHPDMQV